MTRFHEFSHVFPDLPLLVCADAHTRLLQLHDDHGIISNLVELRVVRRTRIEANCAVRPDDEVWPVASTALLAAVKFLDNRSHPLIGREFYTLELRAEYPQCSGEQGLQFLNLLSVRAGGSSPDFLDHT